MVSPVDSRKSSPVPVKENPDIPFSMYSLVHWPMVVVYERPEIIGIL